ncbi:unnamed protein product [Amoebophrya sp. A25]|nr:unnamed protein product [Amoebophrya sp. A25]|eukprot:GSA25T00000499001.1
MSPREYSLGLTPPALEFTPRLSAAASPAVTATCKLAAKGPDEQTKATLQNIEKKLSCPMRRDGSRKDITTTWTPTVVSQREPQNSQITGRTDGDPTTTSTNELLRTTVTRTVIAPPSSASLQSAPHSSSGGSFFTRSSQLRNDPSTGIPLPRPGGNSICSSSTGTIVCTPPSRDLFLRQHVTGSLKMATGPGSTDAPGVRPATAIHTPGSTTTIGVVGVPRSCSVPGLVATSPSAQLTESGSCTFLSPFPTPRFGRDS